LIITLRCSASSTRPYVQEDAVKRDTLEDAFDYLTAWFRVLGPARVERESAVAMDDIPSFGDRLPLLRDLERITTNSLAAGTRLPFETFVRENGLDLVDRLILLALLRSAHDPQSQGGLRLIRIMWALGADDVGRQVEIRRKLDREGALRDLGLVECAPHPDLTQRLYRLPRRLVDYLTSGEGNTLGLPLIPKSRQEALDALEYDTRRLVDAVRLPVHETHEMWQGVRKGHPDWDWTALRRERLAARLEASYRSETDAIGTELRRLDLTGDERLAWTILFLDSSAEQVGLAVPFVPAFAGWNDDAEAAAERLLGGDSKLGKAGVLRFNRANGPLLARLVAISQEARARVALWPRNAFAMKPGNGLDLVADEQRSLGFGTNGGGRQDRASSTGRPGQ
jgi:hypothetical protein